MSELTFGEKLREEVFDKIVPNIRKHKKKEIDLEEFKDPLTFDFCGADFENGFEYCYKKGRIETLKEIIKRLKGKREINKVLDEINEEIKREVN